MQREIVKWLQSLDLSGAVRNARHDLANGFFVAEILSRYDKSVSMHSFDTGLSTATKWDNWHQIEKILSRIGCTTVSPSEVAGVVGGQEGAAQKVLEKVYCFLTKKTFKVEAAPRSTPEEQVPLYARQTAATLLHTANNAAKERVSKISGDLDEKNHRQENEAIVTRHRVELNTLKVVEPERFAARKAAPISKEEIKVKPKYQKFQATRMVNVRNFDSEIVATFVERDQREKEEAFKRGFSDRVDLTQSLSRVCHRELQKFGSLDIVSKGADDDNFFIGFLAARQNLMSEVKVAVWEALLSVSRNTAALCVRRPSEFLHLMVNLSFLFAGGTARKNPSEDADAVHGFTFLSEVGNNARKLNSDVSRTFLDDYFVPAVSPCIMLASPHYFETLIAVLCRYVDTNHLEDVKFVISVIQKCLPCDDDHFVFRAVHNVLKCTDFSYCLGADGLCQYYAILAAGSSNAVSRGYSLLLLELLLTHNHGLVLPLLTTVQSLGLDNSWEVRLAQMRLLCKLMDELLCESTFPSEETNTAELDDAGNVEGNAYMPSILESIRKTFDSFYDASPEQRLLSIQVVASHLDYDRDSHLCRSFVKALLSLDDRIRVTALSNGPSIIVPGKVCPAYILGGIVQVWNALAIAQGLMDTKGSIGMFETMSLLEPLVLTTYLAPSRDSWLEILSQVKGELVAAMFEPGRLEDISPQDASLCSEMACSITMKYYADLSGDTIEEKGDLADIQQRAADWLQANA